VGIFAFRHAHAHSHGGGGGCGSHGHSHHDNGNHGHSHHGHSHSSHPDRSVNMEGIYLVIFESQGRQNRGEHRPQHKKIGEGGNKILTT